MMCSSPPCRNAPVRIVHGRDMRKSGTNARDDLREGNTQVARYMRMQIAIIA